VNKGEWVCLLCLYCRVSALFQNCTPLRPDRVWWRNRDFRKSNTHVIWGPCVIQKILHFPQNFKKLYPSKRCFSVVRGKFKNSAVLWTRNVRRCSSEIYTIVFRAPGKHFVQNCVISSPNGKKDNSNECYLHRVRGIIKPCSGLERHQILSRDHTLEYSWKGI